MTRSPLFLMLSHRIRKGGASQNTRNKTAALRRCSFLISGFERRCAPFPSLKRMARVTGLEPATSGVTGRHSNQLSYTRVPLREEEKCGLRATHDGVKRNVRGC